MGIKMNKVRCNGQELKINEYDVNKKYGDLKCYYCDADVSFVNSHENYSTKIFSLKRWGRT